MGCDKCSSFALQFIGQVMPKKSTMVGYKLQHWIGVPPAPNSSPEFGADFNKIMYDWFLVEAFCLITFSKNVTTMNSKATGQKKRWDFGTQRMEQQWIHLNKKCDFFIEDWTEKENYK